MDSFKLEWSAVQIVHKGEEEPAWKFGLTQTPEQRISVVELLPEDTNRGQATTLL